MDTIDLDAIIEDKIWKTRRRRRRLQAGQTDDLKDAIKEAIHQALVLASENALKDKNKITGYITLLRGESFEGWMTAEIKGYLTCLESIMAFIHNIDPKQSILDVEKHFK